MDVGSDGSGRRRSVGAVAGSVWERRMRSDQVKGGIKVFGIVEGINDENEGVGVKVKRTGNLEKESPMTVRKSRRTWGNRDEPGKGLGLHPVKEFFELEEVGGDNPSRPRPPPLAAAASADGSDETCKELGVCHVGREKSGSGKKVQPKFHESVDRGNDGDGDVFFHDEGFEGGDGFNDGNEEVDFPKCNGAEQQRTRKVVSGEKKVVGNHFPLYEKPKSIRKVRRKPDSSELGGVSGDDGCVAEARIIWQSLVDLVMWRDVTQTAFVFGLGTLVVVLSSFAGNLDISLVSLFSHLGFFALATVFICKSIFGSDWLDQDETTHAVRQEEALNFTRSALPYINTFLSKFRAVLSGEPAITMKLAILLFVIARWADYLSIAALLKLGYLGAFTLPKLYSKYSKQLHGHGTSWIRRIKDAWESCSYKRAVALVAFLILWNFSSAISRVCIVFLVYLALRYHDHERPSARDISAGSRRRGVEEVDGKGA